jgi:hypothetical protein
MRALKRQFVMVVGMLAIFFLPLPVAFASSNGLMQDAREMGCIVREPGLARFLRNDLADKEAIGEAAVNAHRLRGTKVIDPCLTGQVRNIPAAVYAVLVKKYPEKFQPLEAEDQGVVPQATSNTAPHVASEYHYIGISEGTPPEVLLFDPIALTNDSRIYGTAYTEFFDEAPFFTTYAAVFERGALTVLQESKGIIATTANEVGMVGGYVITDFENFFTQAALFRGNEVQLIPRLPGEIHSQVLKINDPGVALIFSQDENFNGKLALYKNGEVTPLDVGPDIPFASSLSMNNQGIISGTTFIDGLGSRGFRFDSHTNVVMLLEPLPTEPDSWAMGINNRGDVLGYSFVGGGIERIGVWDKKGVFHTYFVEGTPEFPTVSNRLRFNDNNLIVITRVSRPASETNNSYLVPKPGVRLNLADLVTDTPLGLSLFPYGINNLGNMFGSAGPNYFNIFDYFLLERTGTGNE